MFYSTQILSRKGPLATIWIASHLEKRLKRAQIFETSIAKSVGAQLGVAGSPRSCAGAMEMVRRHPDAHSHAIPRADSILNPEAPLALRLSGQLLLGIVRVYIRKLQLLESDAQEAISGLQEVRERRRGGKWDGML